MVDLESCDMTSTNAAAALATLAVKDPAQSQSVRPTQVEAMNPPQQSSFRNDRGTFSTKELGQILAALKPLMPESDEHNAEIIEGALKNLAEKRAAGQEAMLVTVALPGGGGIAMVRTPAELAAQLADPEGMGVATTDDGKKYSFADMIKAKLLEAQDEIPAKNDKSIAIMKSVLKIMQKLTGTSGVDERQNEKESPVNGKTSNKVSEITINSSHESTASAVVSIVALPTKASGTDNDDARRHSSFIDVRA